MPGDAAVEPAMGPLGGARRVVAVRVKGGALVEGERDVRAERRLDPHGFLRPEKAARAVEQRLERDALLGDLDLRPTRRGAAATFDLVGHPAVGEREDLEATRVRDDRALPPHEAQPPTARGERGLSTSQAEVAEV